MVLTQRLKGAFIQDQLGKRMNKKKKKKEKKRGALTAVDESAKCADFEVGKESIKEADGRKVNIGLRDLRHSAHSARRRQK